MRRFLPIFLFCNTIVSFGQHKIPSDLELHSLKGAVKQYTETSVIAGLDFPAFKYVYHFNIDGQNIRTEEFGEYNKDTDSLYVSAIIISDYSKIEEQSFIKTSANGKKIIETGIYKMLSKNKMELVTDRIEDDYDTIIHSTLDADNRIVATETFFLQESQELKNTLQHIYKNGRLSNIIIINKNTPKEGTLLTVKNATYDSYGNRTYCEYVDPKGVVVNTITRSYYYFE